MRNAFYILAILLLLPACGENTGQRAPVESIVPDEKTSSHLGKIRSILPQGWKIERVEACDAPDEWKRIAGEKGLYVRVWQQGVSFTEHSSKSGNIYKYTPSAEIYLMPLDWEGSMDARGPCLLVKGGTLMKPKVSGYMNQAVSPARFLGACKEGLLFGEIPWPEHWKSFKEDIAQAFGAMLEISKEHPLCGSKLTVEKAIGEAELVIHAKALNTPEGKSSEYGIITWTGKFEIISLLKGNLAGEGIQVHYQCKELKLHEGYVGEGEEAILFVKEEGGHVPYLRAVKVIWATDENLKTVENVIAEQGGR